jgi:hypothetical protein
MSRDAPKHSQIFQPDFLTITNIDKIYIDQLAEATQATQATYDQLQYHVRLFNFVHADIFHAGITIDSVFPNVHIGFEFSDRCLAVDEEPRKEAVPWLEDARLREKAVDALRSPSIQNSTCTGSESGDNPMRKLFMILDGETVCLEDQVSYMETFGPAFRELHEKGV